MATHKSAIKRNRQNLRHKTRNKAKKNETMALTKKVLRASKEEAVQLFKTLQKNIDKAAKAHTIHWKAAARKVSKISKAIAAK